MFPPAKEPASDLLPESCKCYDNNCLHKRRYVRFTSAAVNGVQHETSKSGNKSGIPEEVILALGLDAASKRDAFLELYGFWLGDGSLAYNHGRLYRIIFNQFDRITVEHQALGIWTFHPYNVLQRREFKTIKKFLRAQPGNKNGN